MWKSTVCVCMCVPEHLAPSGLIWFLKLHSLQQALETEVVGVAVDGGLAGRRTHHLRFERGEGVGSASLHVHLQLQQDLQGVGHLGLTTDRGWEAIDYWFSKTVLYNIIKHSNMKWIFELFQVTLTHK